MDAIDLEPVTLVIVVILPQYVRGKLGLDAFPRPSYAGGMVENLEHLLRRAARDPRASRAALYKELLECTEGRSVMLEEYAREMVYAEELHAGEVDKMLRRPGEIAEFEHRTAA